MRRFDDNLLKFIKQNIMISDLAENFLNLEKNRKKSTKKYAVFDYNDDKIIVNNDKNTFFAAKNEAGGNIFDFVMYVENLDFVNAVKTICNYYNLDYENNINYENDKNIKKILNIKKEKEEEKEKIERKARQQIHIFENMKSQKINYDIRAISKDLLNFLINAGYLKYYENDKYKTLKIPMYKYFLDGTTKIIGIQDIFSEIQKNHWHKYNKGHAGLFVAGELKNCDKIVFTEAAFDALSAYQLSFDKHIKKNKFYNMNDLINDLAVVSINGSLSELKKESIVNLLKNYNNISTLILAFDTDEVGKKYIDEVINLLKENELFDKFKDNIVKISYAGAKDLNELLQAKKAKQKEIEQQKEVINTVKKIFKPKSIEIA